MSALPHLTTVAEDFTEPSTASGFFPGQMAYTNQEMVAWKTQYAMNFSKLSVRAYGRYNPHMEMCAEPSELYQAPLVSNK